MVNDHLSPEIPENWIGDVGSDLPPGVDSLTSEASLSEKKTFPDSMVFLHTLSRWEQSKSKVPPPVGVVLQPGVGTGSQSMHHCVPIVHERLVQSVGQNTYSVLRDR